MKLLSFIAITILFLAALAGVSKVQTSQCEQELVKGSSINAHREAAIFAGVAQRVQSVSTLQEFKMDWRKAVELNDAGSTPAARSKTKAPATADAGSHFGGDRNSGGRVSPVIVAGACSQKGNERSQNPAIASPVISGYGQKLKYLGTFRVTAYDAFCVRCCGKTDGITATGHKITAKDYGRIIAVDPKVIPLHSRVFIEGVGWCGAEDVGSAIKGNRIDLLLGDHKSALIFGVKTLKVYFKER